ncbi:DUF4188 domain-containing protein [Gloeobacter morelensis]|uniref:DUF4188 domain-containing protein n=1 Tax=Gloeobacter morelensis MG652769 TaxID=2781736 RepID=A0ABY3PPG8_9CYAN|nr:DUF4188 domain-containing protein [Gloeobacter morelensis]UFP95597.1 DUF4188 domain-containing protein [Gloeobacter morelensis MG652769]
MTQVMAGRYTARVEGSFVVFLIGMRINQFWAVGKWVPTLRAMGPMLRTLYRNPEKGFLGGETFLYWRGVALVSYWRSFEDLEKFARSPEEPHLEAWRRFQRSVGADGSVGIWHESYLVEPGHYEAMYGNMPRFGLAAATEHIPIARRRETARGRIGAAKTQE